MAVFVTVLGSSFQFGYGNGVLNTLEGPMKSLWDDSGTSSKFSSWTTVWSLTTGFWCTGGMLGALSGGPAADIIGRKWSIVLTNIFTLSGSFLQAYPMGVYHSATTPTQVWICDMYLNFFSNIF